MTLKVSSDERDTATTTDIRFTEPLYTAKQAARYLGVGYSTFHYWAYGRGNTPPVVHAFESRGRYRSAIPFIGLAEGLVVSAFEKAGLGLRQIRRAIDILQAEEGGLEYALASKKLFVSGKSILLDHATNGDPELADLFTKNGVFVPTVRQYLKLISYSEDGWPQRVRLPITQTPIVEVDPRRAFGKPLFVSGGAPVEAVMNRFAADEPLDSLAMDFGIAEEDVIEMARAYVRWSKAA